MKLIVMAIRVALLKVEVATFKAVTIMLENKEVTERD